MTEQSYQAKLVELQNQLSDLRRRQRERQGKRVGLGHGALNARGDMDLAQMFNEDQHRADDAKVAELEAAIAEHQAQDPRRVDELRARDFLAPWRQENDGNAS